MNIQLVVSYLYALLVCCHVALSQMVLGGDPSKIPPNPHKSDQPVSGTIKMGTPDLSDEESMSIHMPKYLNCDACRIISMRFSDSLRKEIEKYPSIKKGKKELTEDRVDDILEGVCDDDWGNYGIKEVDGVNRLSGPGFETSDVPGIMQGGGKWPFRFKQMCEMILGDVGEEVIYEIFRKGDAAQLEKRLCFSSIEGMPGFCEKKTGKEKKKGKNEGKPKKKAKKPETKKPENSHNEL